MSKVFLSKCTDYDLKQIEDKIRSGFSALGGDKYIRTFIKENSRILLKPNMLVGDKKASLATTHYIFFEAVIRVLKDYSQNIIYGDSPGFGEVFKSAQVLGLQEVAEKYNVKFENFNKECLTISYKDGILCKSFDIAKAAYECDVLITLPRIKTHSMMLFTGSIKNQFGCIPGVKKTQFHARMQNVENFSKMLLDLNGLLKTDFSILDGIIAMEGNGPKNGDPYNLNCILMGDDIVAVDSVATKLIGYDNPTDTPVLREAAKYGIGETNLSKIEILGDKLEDLIVHDFKLIMKKQHSSLFYIATHNDTIKKIFIPKPKLNPEKCIGCKRCNEVCPKKDEVIKFVSKNGKLTPSWNMNKCITCFCCQELCPTGAIYAKQSLIQKLLDK
ncbi:MAG: DUF362 domain-containing protein [Oscillospiraceae bacterium]|nr:DUF362 domain-containing protein [Oscillospiraceae bacterium]